MLTELVGELIPRQGPGINTIQAVAAGYYTEIVDVIAPDSAEAGSTVRITVKIKNLASSTIYMGPYAEADTLWAIFEPSADNVAAGAILTSTGTFTMPDKGVRVHLQSRYWTADGWYYDDEAYFDIQLIGWQLLDSRTLSVRAAAPPVVGWQLLDSRILSVRAAVAPPVGWQLLDSRTLSVRAAAPPVVGWQELDSRTIGVTAGPPVSDWELIQHTIYYWAYFYEGDAGVCEFEFTLPPEQFPWTESIAKKVVEELASRLEAEGSKLLELKIYLDRAGPLWSRWKGEITVADIEQGGVSGIAIAPALIAALPWIIKGAIIAAVILVIYFAIIKPIITVFFKPKTLSEDVKRKWSRETLILAIIDLRPAYSREALEEMTDQELRDVLNEIYEEEVGPPAGLSWLWVALIGGLAVSGSAIGVYALSRFLPKKKE
ncbi:hypothetical protein ES703_65313 [subsurface metagenome]